jgi:hypothetical protein
MKREDFKEQPPCLLCNAKETELHELIFGQGVRQISIDNNIQAWLCQMHHKQAHRSQDWSIRLFRILGLDYEKLKRIVKNKSTDKWTNHDTHFVEMEGQKVYEYYRRWM